MMPSEMLAVGLKPWIPGGWSEVASLIVSGKAPELEEVSILALVERDSLWTVCVFAKRGEVWECESVDPGVAFERSVDMRASLEDGLALLSQEVVKRRKVGFSITNGSFGDGIEPESMMDMAWSVWIEPDLRTVLRAVELRRMVQLAKMIETVSAVGEVM